MPHPTVRFAQDDRAATAIEYGLLAGLMTVLFVVGATGLSGRIVKLFDDIGTTFVTETGKA